MIVRYLNSFDRSFADLEPELKERVNQAMEALLNYFENREKAVGLGLKKLRDPYWEIRAGLRIRMIFSLDQDLLTFILVGDHSAIKKFLHQT